MKLIFAGYGELGATVLEALAVKHSVALVLTHPTDFGGLGEPDVSELAVGLGLPVIYSKRAGEAATHAAVRDADADALVCTNWRTMLPPEVFAVPRLGSLNVHDALLPAYAGFGAVNWAVRNDEHETGVTVHLMTADFDSGAIVVQQRVPIGRDDTATVVYWRVLERYVPATLAALDLLAGGFRGTPQSGDRSVHAKIGLADTEIDWSRSALELYNLVRGQSAPYLNAWTTWAGDRLFVLSAARPTSAFRAEPGQVIGEAEAGVAVGCGTPGQAGALILREVRAGSGSAISASQLLAAGPAQLGRHD